MKTALTKPAQMPELARLAELLRAYAPEDGTHPLPLPGVYAVRASQRGMAFNALYQPSLCIVAQGAKSVALGQEVYLYDEAHMLVTFVELPAVSRLVRGSPERPFLGLRLDLEAKTIADLTLRVYPKGLPPAREDRGLRPVQADPGMVDAARRLVEHLDQRAWPLASLALEEILIRLLLSPLGPRVARLGLADSQLRQMERAIRWLRENFHQPLRVPELAAMVHMSPSAFHRRFKAVTGMSPLAFQKFLRLWEARRLLLQGLSVGEASLRVGYLSLSQFSREYSRLFGQPASRDRGRGGAFLEGDYAPKDGHLWNQGPAASSWAKGP